MKNFFLKLGVCALALTGAAEVLAQEQVIQLFAHRGSRFEYDENTLPAFKASSMQVCAVSRPTSA